MINKVALNDFLQNKHDDDDMTLMMTMTTTV